jgi:hypothetical protein
MSKERLEELELEAKRQGNNNVLNLIQNVTGTAGELGAEISEIDDLIKFCEFQLSDATDIEKRRNLIKMKIEQLKKLNYIVDAGVEHIIEDIENVLEMVEDLPESEIENGYDMVSMTIDECMFSIIM